MSGTDPGGDVVVAIDGPAGSGKSTVARAVAAELGLPTLDTGAMYRAVTWAVLRAGVDPADADAVADVAARVRVDAGPPVRVDGQDVSTAVRGAAVTAAVSAVAAVPGVRRVLVDRQRAWIDAHGGGVVEGRDIGTVVAPDAGLKVFLVATEEERARRRHAEDPGGAAPAGLAGTLDDLRRRDRLDSTRAHAPLAAAADAVVLDTTGRTVEEVVAEVVDRYHRVVAARSGEREAR